MLVSESKLGLLTKKDRKTIRSRLVDVPFEPGPQSAKLYESDVALGVIYGVGADYKKGVITPQEAARRLTLKRTEEIDLNMESIRRERIPLEDVEEHNDAVLQNVAGIFKANEGKKLTPELVQEIFAELRRMEEVLVEFSKGQQRREKAEPDVMEDPLLQ